MFAQETSIALVNCFEPVDRRSCVREGLDRHKQWGLHAHLRRLSFHIADSAMASLSLAMRKTRFATNGQNIVRLKCETLLSVKRPIEPHVCLAPQLCVCVLACRRDTRWSRDAGAWFAGSYRDASFGHHSL